MVRRKEAQISSLVYVAVALVLFLCDVDTDDVALTVGCPLSHRLFYQFFHASWLHLAMNCWALLCIVFLYGINVTMMVESFIIAASFPAGFLSFMYPNPMLPTIGASGMIYALLGRYAFSIEKIVKYNLWWAFFIGMGFLFPYANAPLHLYCYLCGFILALLNKPISL